MTGTEKYGLVGAYALDALDADERELFEHYLATTPEVAQEVDELREAAATLAMTTAMTPPPALRGSIMSAVDNERQVPPVVATSLDDRRAAKQRPATHEWVTNLAYGAAAMAAVIAVGLGVALSQLSTRVDDIRQTAGQVATVLAADDAEQVSADFPDGGRLGALVSAQGGSAVVVGQGLPALDDEQMYALWTVNDGLSVPVGELVDGEPLTVMDQPFGQIAVTVEPRGPLTQPTTPAISTLSV